MLNPHTFSGEPKSHMKYGGNYAYQKTLCYLLAELKNRLKISIFLWRKKLCISLIFSNFVVSNYKVIYFTLCTTCMQIS